MPEIIIAAAVWEAVTWILSVSFFFYSFCQMQIGPSPSETQLCSEQQRHSRVEIAAVCRRRREFRSVRSSFSLLLNCLLMPCLILHRGRLRPSWWIITVFRLKRAFSSVSDALMMSNVLRVSDVSCQQTCWRVWGGFNSNIAVRVGERRRRRGGSDQTLQGCESLVLIWFVAD